MMTKDDFADQVARVRARFASTLNSKVADSFADLEKMASGGLQSIEIAIVAHRRLHEMYGIAPTLGFASTGKAAGVARTTIGEAAKSKRAPTAAEIAALKTELESLRAGVAADLEDYAKGETANAP